MCSESLSPTPDQWCALVVCCRNAVLCPMAGASTLKARRRLRLDTSMHPRRQCHQIVEAVVAFVPINVVNLHPIEIVFADSLGQSPSVSALPGLCVRVEELPVAVSKPSLQCRGSGTGSICVSCFAHLYPPAHKIDSRSDSATFLVGALRKTNPTE